MSLYGVVAGIDGNREALSAVLEALDKRAVRQIACLGDVVGLNADPEECVELVRRRCAVALAGRHDLVCVDRLDFDACSTEAEYSLRRTRRSLQGESKRWLATLAAAQVLEDGVVLQSVREEVPGARLCFYGDGREQKVYEVRGNAVHELAGERHLLHKERTYFVSPGSVDASRRRGRLAACALFDTLEWSVQFLRVPYDSAASEAKAAVFGYRINALTDQLYTLRRRTASAARRIGARLQRGAHSGR
jgi:hypothetical protein